MSLRGIGDRWLAGEAVPGVTFRHNDAVEITSGEHAGSAGVILLLMGLRPEPRYLVELRRERRDVRVPQSALLRME